MKNLKHENESGRVMGPVTGVLKLLAAVLLAVSPEAWVLYAIVFLWQFPHFMPIAWMYREDYTRAGYLVLPLGEQRDRFVIWQSLAVALALIPLSLIPTIVGESGLVYSVWALILGLIFVYNSARALIGLHRSKTPDKVWQI
jgi:protoheme IX farnesyltransferase